MMSVPHCPYCHSEIQAHEAVRCLTCRTLHHGECIAVHGGCVIHGCQSRAVLVGDARHHIDEYARQHGLTIAKFECAATRKDLEPFYLRVSSLHCLSAAPADNSLMSVSLDKTTLKRGNRLRGLIQLNTNQPLVLKTLDFKLSTKLTTVLPAKPGRAAKTRESRLIQRIASGFRHADLKSGFLSNLFVTLGTNVQAGCSEIQFSMLLDAAFPLTLEHKQGGEADSVSTVLSVTANFAGRVVNEDVVIKVH